MTKKNWVLGFFTFLKLFMLIYTEVVLEVNQKILNIYAKPYKLLNTISSITELRLQ